VGTVDHQLHHSRKQALASFFSKASVLRLEPLIQDKVNNLRDRLFEFKGRQEAVNISDVFSAFSGDVIGSYVFGIEYGFLQNRRFAPEWRNTMTELSRSTHLMKQFGWMYPVIKRVADGWLGAMVARLYKPLGYLFDIRKSTDEAIETARSRADCCTSAEKSNVAATRLHLTSVIESLLSSSTHQLPATELTTARLTDECLTLLGAGSVTTAQTLTTAVYFILASKRTDSSVNSDSIRNYPVGSHLAILSSKRRSESDHKPNSQPLTVASKLQSIRHRLCDELAEFYASHKNPTWSQLSQLRYLTAVLYEALRLSYGVASRLPRISPDTEMVLPDGRIIPQGTPVSMTQMFLHDDPLLFPNPLTFDPERWLTSDVAQTTTDARKYFVPFSRGTRACLGTNLAWAELYMCIAGLFRPVECGGVDLELFDTAEQEIRVEHDYFNPAPAKGAKGVRVIVK
jgi:cytochrome P450